MTKKRILHLHLKRTWWQQIRDGIKTTELRRVTDYWRRRLVGQVYDEIHLHCGYPKKGDTSRTLRRYWRGHFTVTVKHEEFGGEPTEVFCIDVSKEVGA